MADHGLCDTDSSGEDSIVVDGVSVQCFRKRRERRGADAAARHRDRIRAIDAKKKRLHRAEESAEQRRLWLEAENLRKRCMRAMKK